MNSPDDQQHLGSLKQDIIWLYAILDYLLKVLNDQDPTNLFSVAKEALQSSMSVIQHPSTPCLLPFNILHHLQKFHLISRRLSFSACQIKDNHKKAISRCFPNANIFWDALYKCLKPWYLSAFPHNFLALLSSLSQLLSLSSLVSFMAIFQATPLLGLDYLCAH